MKNKYLSNHGSGPLSRLWVLLVLLLAIPLWGQAQTFSVVPSDPATPQNFGSVAVGEASAPKSYTVTGSGLTSSIFVALGGIGGGSRYEISRNSTTGYSGAAIELTPDASGNISTTVYARFRPNATGAANGRTLTFSTEQEDVSDFFSYTLNGTGVAGSPAITVSPTALGFGNQTINTTSMAMSVTVTATSLTAPVVVTAPAGFQVSTSANGTYSQSLSLPQNTSGAVNATVFVVFAPTAAQNYVDVVTFASTGATTRNVSVSGTGVLPPASLAVTPTSLDFGTLQAGQVSAPQSFTVTGTNVTTAVTVAAPTGYLVRVGTTGTYSQSVTLTPSNNSINSTLQAIFSPSAAGTFTGDITASTTGNGGATAAVSVTGTATPQPTGPFIVVNPSTLDFGSISGSGSAQTLSFTLNAGNLTEPLTLTGSSNIIRFRDATAGGSFTNGPVTIAPVNGTISSRTIEVQLTGPIPAGNFSGTITASSSGATAQVVAISGNSSGGESVINPSSTNLNLFSTVPGVPSAVQSYQLSGTNLLQDITVTAPQFFQVSLNAAFTGITTTGNSITVARNNGPDVTSTTVYVRFVPSSALSTSANVLNTSNPALGVAVRVQGTSEPSVILQNSFQLVRNVVLNTRSASQALTVIAERVLQPITISQLLSANSVFNPTNTAQFEFSRDNVNFTTDTLLLRPNTTTYSINRPIYVRYRPTNLGSAQATLQFQSNDFDNKGVQSFPTNALLSGLPIDVEPTLRSTANVVRNGSTATVSFNLPPNYAAQGYGEGRLIVASTNPTLPASNQPTDGVSYQTGNQTYGQGPQVAPGYYAVFAGPNTTVTVDGLDLATTYYFYTFEFNNIDNNVNVIASGAENYLSPPVPTVIEGIEAPSPLPVSLVSFTAKVRGNSVALTWKTASELNNKGFEVQRSRDGQSFETILTREGKGTTSVSTTYNATDDKPLNGVSYYRLKQIDFDGTSTLSSPVVVSFLSAGEVVMYPNPVESELTIELAGAAEGVRVTIADMTGRIIRTQTLPATGKLNVGDLQVGTYLVTVGEGTAKVTRRIVKK